MKFPAGAAAAIIFFFAAAAADLGLRSRWALREAAKHEAWLENPALKKKHCDGLLDRKLSALEKEVSSGRIKREEADRKAALLAAERDLSVSESSAKLAWLWNRTAAEKFHSPLNPWAARAARRLPAARAAWRAELSAQGVKTGDWMFE